MLKYRYKLGLFLSKIKGLFSRKFQYRYKTYSMKYKVRDLVIKNNKQLWVFSILISLVFSFYLVSETMTGYITYTEDVETELNKTIDLLLLTQEELDSIRSAEEGCQANLLSTEKDLSIYKDKLEKSESYLLDCEKERDDLKSYSDQLNILITTCEDERKEFKEKYENVSESLDNLIDNTVSLVCCRPGIEVSEWDITDDKIICSGPFTVDCITGEISY